ncbi:MAG: DUF885 domain-containing protein [Verrucomicrobiae bacterium]|nr:DUF885 domain-containing protein [Verrucomicrobiae bacterium]
MKRKPAGRSLQIVTRPADSHRRFLYLAERYHEETFARFPITASSLGRREFNSTLGHATPQTFQNQLRLVERTLAEIENLPANQFPANDWLDRRALLAELRAEQMNLGDLSRWQTNPERHASAAVESVHHLVIRNADNLRPVVDAIESRLRQIPAYLAEAASCVHRPVPLWTKLARQTCQGVPSFFDSLADQLTAASDASRFSLTSILSREGRGRTGDRGRRTPQSNTLSPCRSTQRLSTGGRGQGEGCGGNVANKVREHWQKLLSDAKLAFARYAKTISAKTPGAHNGYCIGRERFEFLIRERLGLQITAREAEAVARGLVAQLDAELAREARKFSTRKSVREILDQAARDWRPREKDLLAEYQRVTTVVREKFLAARAMTFPEGDKLLVKPVPDFLRHQFPTAAYNSPGPYEKKQIGIFWVNDLSLTKKSAAEKQKEIRQHFGLELTAAHEAYPGHHLQFVTQNRHPSHLRRLVSHSIYYEGWTLWVEQMTADLRITRNPYARLTQLHDALWRAHRILVDCGLQTGTMDYAAACRHLQRHVGFTAARAQGDVNWYTAAPTVPMSYLLGKYELLRLKQKRVDKGGWSLKKFNDWVLSFGAIPWTWIEASGL